MLILLSLAVILVGMSLMMNIYSIFSPFIENLGQVYEYNQAYYGAIGGLERAELVIKTHTFGFEGSGGWIGGSNYGPTSDHKITNLSRLGFEGNGMGRSIKSLSDNNILPNPGKGNIEPDMRRNDAANNGGLSADYNKFEVGSSMEIPLYKDTASSNANKYYTGGNNLARIGINSLSATFRLPPKVRVDLFANDSLDEVNDRDMDGIKNDIIVDRTIMDMDPAKSPTDAIKIFPSTSLDFNAQIDEETDSNIRESDINVGGTTSNITFDNNRNPTTSNVSNTHNEKTFNIVPLNSSLSGNTFANLFTNNTVLLLIQFRIPNIVLKSVNGNIFPYLEYKMSINGTVGEKYPLNYFTINGNGKVGKYNVSIQLNKKILDASSEGFSTIHF